MHVIDAVPVPARSGPPRQIGELAERGHVIAAWNRPPSGLAGLAHTAVVLVDARDDVAAALRFCRGFRRVRTETALVVTVRAENVAALGGDWPVDDFVLAGSSTTEWERRLTWSLDRRRLNGDGPVQKLGDLTLDGNAFVLHVPGRTIALTRTECRVLRLFFSNPGVVLTRQVLSTQGWGDAISLGRNVDTFVCRLRHKLGPAARSLSTVRGVGYRFLPELDSRPTQPTSPARRVARAPGRRPDELCPAPTALLVRRLPLISCETG